MIQQEPGMQTGAYMASLTTGVLAATLAADAPIFAIRNGPTQTDFNPSTSIGAIAAKRFVHITSISLRVSSIVAFTAAQQFGLYLQRFSVANLAGGAAALILKVNESGAPDSACLSGGAEAGDTRVATTAALTVVGVTFDATSKIPIYGWTTVGPAEYFETLVEFETDALRLAPGEGLAIRNSIVWPAAGTGVVTGFVRYQERSQ